jgi:hypothetical protein
MLMNVAALQYSEFYAALQHAMPEFSASRAIGYPPWGKFTMRNLPCEIHELN